jgi:hypothetical protein
MVKCGSIPQRLTKLKERVGFTMENMNEFQKEEFISMQLKMRKIQDDVLNKYFTNPATIQWNVLESIRGVASSCSTLEQFKSVLDKNIENITNTMMERKLTYIEEVEYRFIKKIYRDVIVGKGKEFSADKDLIFQYDQHEIKVEPISFHESEIEE